MQLLASVLPTMQSGSGEARPLLKQPTIALDLGGRENSRGGSPLSRWQGQWTAGPRGVGGGMNLVNLRR